MGVTNRTESVANQMCIIFAIQVPGPRLAKMQPNLVTS